MYDLLSGKILEFGQGHQSETKIENTYKYDAFFIHSTRLLLSINFLPVSTKHEIINHFHPSFDYHLPFLRIGITSCIQE